MNKPPFSIDKAREVARVVSSIFSRSYTPYIASPSDCPREGPSIVVRRSGDAVLYRFPGRPFAGRMGLEVGEHVAVHVHEPILHPGPFAVARVLCTKLGLVPVVSTVVYTDKLYYIGASSRPGYEPLAWAAAAGALRELAGGDTGNVYGVELPVEGWMLSASLDDKLYLTLAGPGYVPVARYVEASISVEQGDDGEGWVSIEEVLEARGVSVGDS